MEILKTNRLDQRQTQQIVALENKCFIRDGLENHAYLTNDLNFDPQMPCFFLCYEGDALVAFLTAFAPERAQAEALGDALGVGGEPQVEARQRRFAAGEDFVARVEAVAA